LNAGGGTHVAAEADIGAERRSHSR
jgi:hypothetical protein